MKAFILAAGNGERLRPITNTIPKCLVPIRGVPLLGIWLELCRRHQIDEVLINTHSHAEVLHNYVRHHSSGISVQTTHETHLLGSAGTLLENQGWIGSDSEFWVFYGDVLTNLDLQQMLSFHRTHNMVATLGVYAVPNPGQCGIVSIDEDHAVQDFVEKPTDPCGNLAFAGVLLATPAIFGEIPDDVPCDLGFHVLPRLSGRMTAYTVNEYLLDIGTFKNYQHAQLTWPGLDAEVAPGSVIDEPSFTPAITLQSA